MKRLILVILVLTVLVANPRPAEAYLDANTGSLILQLLLGGMAGIAVIGKLYWHRIATKLGLRKTENGDS
jgi:hypothetical protein